MDTPSVADQPVQVATPLPWSFAEKIAFRFFGCFFLLCIASDFIPGLSDAFNWLWLPVVRWTGANVLGLPGPLSEEMTGSGDKLFHWVTLFTTILVSLLAALIWSLLDRRRPAYRRAQAWLRLLVRYYLGWVLISYGLSKAFHLQMPYASLGRLMEAYGDSSPMGLLWTFIGHSKAYSAFSGGAEILGGLLLLFRRTVLIGSLVSVAVLLQVVMMNFCFDVPVKIYSSLLLLMALYLAAPDARRLFDFFFLHKTLHYRPITPLFQQPKWQKWAMVIKGLLLAFVAYSSISGHLAQQKVWGDAAPKPALYGIYDVTSLSRNGALAPPLGTDTAYWRKLIVSRPGFASVRMANDTLRGFKLEVDTATHSIFMQSRLNPLAKMNFSYSQPTPEDLLLESLDTTDRLRIVLRRFDERQFLLVRRGFHWVNEFPYNR